MKEQLTENHKSYLQKVENIKCNNPKIIKKRPASASAKIDTRNPK